MARHADGPWFRAAKNTWYATVGGKKVSLRVQGAGNEPAARVAWHRLMADAGEANAHPPDRNARTATMTARTAKQPTPLPLSVGDVVDAFLADAGGRLKPTTVRIYGEYLARLKATCGGKRAADLLPVDLHRWMLTTGKSSTTHGIALRSASACLGWAEKNDMIPANVAKKVPKPKSKSRSADAVITDADHAKLMTAANAGFRTVLRVLHGTGCRPGEAAKITTDTFDPDNAVVRLTDHKADRTGRPRLIFLPPDVCELLRAQARRFKSGALLRSNKGFAWTGRSITQAMRRIGKKAGVRGIAYGYRHGFATAALSRGVPDAHVAALLGHTSTAVLHAHYSHLTEQAGVLRAALANVRGGGKKRRA